MYTGCASRISPGRSSNQPKLVLLDYLASAMAGYKINRIFNDALWGVVSDMGGKKESRVLFQGARLPAPLAALMNAAYGHGADLDDGNRTAQGHPGVGTIPAVLALAEAHGLSGRDVIVAIVAGYDIFVRMATALNPVPSLPGLSHHRDDRDHRRSRGGGQSPEAAPRRGSERPQPRRPPGRGASGGRRKRADGQALPPGQGRLQRHPRRPAGAGRGRGAPRAPGRAKGVHQGLRGPGRPGRPREGPGKEISHIVVLHQALPGLPAHPRRHRRGIETAGSGASR